MQATNAAAVALAAVTLMGLGITALARDLAERFGSVTGVARGVRRRGIERGKRLQQSRWMRRVQEKAQDFPGGARSKAEILCDYEMEYSFI